MEHSHEEADPECGPGSELLACTLYTVTITVVNPLEVPCPSATCPPATSSVLQAAQDVTILALGKVDGTSGQVVIPETTMDVDRMNQTLITLPGTHFSDVAPMLVYKPTFLVKKVVHSSPYPGGGNTITVTISANKIGRASCRERV